jgi:hypothetical protein
MSTVACPTHQNSASPWCGEVCGAGLAVLTVLEKLPQPMTSSESRRNVRTHVKIVKSEGFGDVQGDKVAFYQNLRDLSRSS